MKVYEMGRSVKKCYVQDPLLYMHIPTGKTCGVFALSNLKKKVLRTMEAINLKERLRKKQCTVTLNYARL